MGRGIGYICKKCGEETHILYGTGMLTFAEDQLLDNQCELLIEMAKDHNVKNMEELKKFSLLPEKHLKQHFGYTCYYCNNCYFVSNKFRYTITSKNKVFRPKYECKYCNNELRLQTKHDEFKLKCDNCGGTEFNKETMHIM